MVSEKRGWAYGVATFMAPFGETYRSDQCYFVSGRRVRNPLFWIVCTGNAVFLGASQGCQSLVVLPPSDVERPSE